MKLKPPHFSDNTTDFYENILNRINNGVLVINTKDIIVYHNEAIPKITNIESEKIIGGNILKNFPEDRIKKFRPFFIKAKKTLKPIKYAPIPIHSLEGRIDYHSGWIIPILEKNSYKGMICTIEDVSEGYIALEKLKESEERYKTLWNSSLVGICISDLNGNVININKKMEEISGFSLEKYQKTNLKKLYVNSTDRDKILNILHTTHEVRDYIVNLIREDGKIYTARLNFNLIKLSGKQCIVTLCEDISRQIKAEEKIKESQQKYRILTTSAPIGIFQLDKNGNCLYINPKASEISGITLEEAVGQGWLQWLHPEDRELILKKWRDSISQQADFNAVYRFKSSLGKITWVEGRIVHLHNDSGEIVGYLGTISDITERKQAELLLK